MDTGIEKRRGRGQIVAGRLAGLFAAALFAGGCEGENIFGADPDAPDAEVDLSPPLIQILEPVEDASYPLAGNIDLRVLLRDFESGVQEVEAVGMTFRGDTTQGTDVWIPRYQTLRRTFTVPLDSTILSEDFTLRPLANNPGVAEFVYIRVRATDAAGNVDSSQVRVSTGGPRVRILDLEPEGGFWRINEQQTVRIEAVDASGEGLESIRFQIEGAMDVDTVFQPLEGDSVVVTWQGTPTAPGVITMFARAMNREGIGGRSPTNVTLDVVDPDVEVPDDVPPTVSLAFSAEERMELTDRLTIRVDANDNTGGAGLRRVGYVLFATVYPGTSPGASGRVAVLGGDTVFASPLQSEFTLAREVDIASVYEVLGDDLATLELPQLIQFDAFAFAVDAAQTPNRACIGAGAAGSCEPEPVVIDGEDFYVRSGASGMRRAVLAVSGRTVRLTQPASIIADAAVDAPRSRMYLSNLTGNRIEVLDLADFAFTGTIAVGSEPWGLFIGDPNELIVANSGGTNIDFVDLSSNPPVRQPNRLLTPEQVLWEVKVSTEGRIHYEVDYHGFSDRPQFVAQDSEGRILYSTVPTSAAQLGSIRLVEQPFPGSDVEIRFLFAGNVINPSDDGTVFANVDRIEVLSGGVDNHDLLRVTTHELGNSSQPIVIEGSLFDVREELETLAAANQIPEPFIAAGSWNVEQVGLSDTTFVAASGDREWVAFGEGATAPHGRVVLWDAINARVSSNLQVMDLVDNAAEVVRGVGLNLDGTLGVARGEMGAYFFTEDLRKQGRFETETGGMGAVLHPSHPSYTGSVLSGDNTLAFVGTGVSTVRIIDTVEFRKRGEISLRARINGPIRASGPLSTDNAGMSCAPPLAAMEPGCVVVNLYATTEDRGVVVVKVRAMDIQP